MNLLVVVLGRAVVGLLGLALILGVVQVLIAQTRWIAKQMSNVLTDQQPQAVEGRLLAGEVLHSTARDLASRPDHGGIG
jgi:hypothetical protein